MKSSDLYFCVKTNHGEAGVLERNGDDHFGMVAARVSVIDKGYVTPLIEARRRAVARGLVK